jgi:hypothetical protein
VGQGRRKDQHSDPRAQTEEERQYQSQNASKGTQDMKRLQAELITAQTQKQEQTGSNGTIARTGSRSPGTSRGSQGTYSTDPGRVRGTDQ